MFLCIDKRNMKSFSMRLWAVVLVSVITFQFKVINGIKSPPPNFVIILTDDQDVVLNGMTPMQRTLKLLANRGATFTNAFTSSPICCPARASLLSGQYAHNHRTINNSLPGGCYGEFWKKYVEPQALPVQLKANGYNTFYAGKYMNQYRSADIPPGYTNWFGLYGNSKYYNYTLNENGNPKKYGDLDAEYLTDVLNVQFTKFMSQQTADKPFFAIIAPPACHSPYTPAKRHIDLFGNITALRTPNFNIPSNELDKHWLVRMPPAPLNDNILDTIDTIYRKRWQTLLAVDELVESIVTQLKHSNLLDNTFMIFTSDNGYHLGQFSMPYDKRQPYETDIRVPFIVIGPGIRSKAIVQHPIVLIDLVPTILDWAGINKPGWLDGQSFADTMNYESNLIDQIEYTSERDLAEQSTTDDSYRYERQLLIEYWGEGTSETYNSHCPWHRGDRLNQCTVDSGCHCQDSWNNTFGCIRHLAHDLDKIYCEFVDRDNFVEAYDLSTDPFQMTNLGFDMLPSERTQYSLSLDKLKQCQGASCQK